MERQCMTNENKIKFKNKSRLQYFALIIFVVILVIAGITCLLVGILKYRSNDNKEFLKDCNSSIIVKKKNKNVPCINDSIIEIMKLNEDQEKLQTFTKRVKDIYYYLYPSRYLYNPSANMSEVFENYKPYDTSWKSIKNRTDTVMKLKKELEDMKINRENLRPREKKGLSQLHHYLDSIFGEPFDENYYSGDWMLGLKYLCWQKFCAIGDTLTVNLNKDNNVLPQTLEHLEKIIEIIKLYEKSIRNFMENMIMGVKVGFVQSVESCEAGRKAFEARFPKVKEEGSKGILSEVFLQNGILDPEYWHKVSNSTKAKFKTRFGKSIQEKIKDVLVQYFGVPLHEFMVYLEKNHSRHCVPSNVASGLGSLPVKYVWLDQNQTSVQTTQRLPTGEKLNGSESYKMILPFFTTVQNLSPAYIAEEGQKQLDILYKRAVKIAMNITGIKNESEAVEKFQIELEHPRHYFNTTVIPDNESGDLGEKLCKTMEMAKKNCPVRYKAMEEWMKYTYSILAQFEYQIIDMFYFIGDKATTPVCPVKLSAGFNAGSSAHFYVGSGYLCEKPATYTIPFFLDKPGPKYISYSVIGHETRPGHHTQMQGFYEIFKQSSKRDVYDWLNINTYYSAFTEGWGLYAENPLLATDTNIYDGELMQEYGMLKLQIWRALRMVIDTGLHERGMTLDEALKLFKKYAWDGSDKALKDVVRYMSLPGQATSYMIGQLAIWKLRNETEKGLTEAGIPFDLKDFHYQILSQGSAPLDFLIEYMKDYTKCKIDAFSRTDCIDIIHHNNNMRQSFFGAEYDSIGTKQQWEYALKMKQSMIILD